MTEVFNSSGVESIDKGALSSSNKEKFKGAFKLKINHDLPMHKKIERYGGEPVVFYLHKNRNFIRKLKLSKEALDEKRISVEK